jgi:hypothetical protein
MAPDATDEPVTPRDGLEKLVERARYASSPEDRARLENAIRLILWARQVVSEARAREQRAWQRALRAAARVERIVRETARYEAELQIIQSRTPPSSRLSIRFSLTPATLGLMVS